MPLGPAACWTISLNCRNSTRGLHKETRGLIRVSCSNVLGHTRITKLVPKFLDENPLTTIEFDLTARYVVGMVEEGYDVAIRFGGQADSAPDRAAARRSPQLRLRHARILGSSGPAGPSR